MKERNQSILFWFFIQMDWNYITLVFELNSQQVDQYNDRNHNPSLILMDNKMIIVGVTFGVMSIY